MEYHISANNSIHLYDSLEHGAVIPSRLGYNLSVTISSTNTTLSAVSNLFNKSVVPKLWVMRRVLVGSQIYVKNMSYSILYTFRRHLHQSD